MFVPQVPIASVLYVNSCQMHSTGKRSCCSYLQIVLAETKLYGVWWVTQRIELNFETCSCLASDAPLTFSM